MCVSRHYSNVFLQERLVVSNHDSAKTDFLMTGSYDCDFTCMDSQRGMIKLSLQNSAIKVLSFF